MRTFLSFLTKLTVWFLLALVSFGIASFIMMHWWGILYVGLTIIIYVMMALLITRFKAVKKAYTVFTHKLGDSDENCSKDD